MRVKPRVLMVTGAYYPELSGGGLQARRIVHALQRAVDFSILTTSVDPRLPPVASDDGVAIRRIMVDMTSVASKLTAGARLAFAFARRAPRIDVVNLHGFSRKAILLVALCRLFRKPFLLTLQTGGHDEPDGVRATGAAAYWAYRSADLYLSVSPGLSRAYLDAGLPVERLRQVCNAIETERFRPARDGERDQLRRELGLPVDLPIVLFVGFFSRDKRPDLLYDAWTETLGAGRSLLLFVGATQSVYHEVDDTIAAAIRERAGAGGHADLVRFVEPTLEIERYFRAADVYVLPSIREGLSIALLEAMASGLAAIATRLSGSTDTMIEPEVNGLLVEKDDRRGLAAALCRLLRDRALTARLGRAARATVVERYSMERTAGSWLSAYEAALYR
ncbi:MAG TPA: glycosyltransferase family 4 protein [Vicinamibacterales bacterium]|nr:glycosyltransferase family 4 protein [Vicinamibacterales bacterium]